MRRVSIKVASRDAIKSSHENKKLAAYIFNFEIGGFPTQLEKPFMDVSANGANRAAMHECVIHQRVLADVTA